MYKGDLYISWVFCQEKPTARTGRLKQQAGNVSLKLWKRLFPVSRAEGQVWDQTEGQSQFPPNKDNQICLEESLLVSLCVLNKLWICGKLIKEVQFVDSEKSNYLFFPYPNSGQHSFPVHISFVLTLTWPRKNGATYGGKKAEQPLWGDGGKNEQRESGHAWWCL